jgi:hypothetical protein
MLFNSPSEVESSPICLAGLLTYASVILGGLPRIFNSSGFGQIAKLSALTATG